MGLLDLLTSFLGAFGGSLIGGGLKVSDGQGNTLTIASSPFTWAGGVFKRISTSGKTYATGEKVEWINEKTIPVVIKQISLIPDANCKLQGAVQVLIDGNAALLTQAAGTMTDAGTINVELGAHGVTLPAGKKIEVQLASYDGSAVALTVLVVVVA